MGGGGFGGTFPQESGLCEIFQIPILPLKAIFSKVCRDKLDTTMNPDLPAPLKRLDMAVRALAWAMLVGVSGAATFVPSTTIISQQPTWMTFLGAVLTGVGGLAAIVAVFRNDHWLELVGGLAVGAGLSAYALTMWSLVEDSLSWMGQAFALTGLIGFVGVQVVRCGVHAYRVRRAYENPPEV